MASFFLVALFAMLALTPLLTIAGHAVWNHSATWTADLLTTTVPELVFTTLQSALPAAVFSLVIGGIPAWLTHRYRFSGRQWATGAALAPLLFSPYLLAGIHLELWSSVAGSPLVHAFLVGCATSPYVFILLRIALARISPQLEDAAQTLGCGPAARFFRVHLPLLLFPLAAASLLAAAESLSDYGAAARLGVRTYSVGMQDLWSGLQTGEVASFLSVLILGPTSIALIALFALVLRRPFMQRELAANRPKLQRRVPPLQRTTIALSLFVIAFGAVLMPIGVNLSWAAQKIGSAKLSEIGSAAITSFLTSSWVTLLTTAFSILMILILPAAWRRIGTIRALWISLLNYGAPSLVLAFAFLIISSDRSPAGQILFFLRDTSFWLIIAIAFKLLPLAIFPVLDSLARTPSSLDDSARTLGLSPLTAKVRIVLPSLRPALTTGAALVFIETMKELTLTMTLQPFGYRALSTQVFSLAGLQLTRDASVWILLMQIVMLFPLWKLYQFVESE